MTLPNSISSQSSTLQTPYGLREGNFIPHRHSPLPETFRLCGSFCVWRSVFFAGCVAAASAGRLLAQQPPPESSPPTSDSGRAKQLQFSRDIRPLLSNACFACHGTDEANRKGGLRLDVPESAQRGGESGGPALAPGHPEDSELIRRIFSDDPAEVMPPPSSRKTLSAEERDRLRLWVTQGAEYETHWAFRQPVSPQVPPLEDYLTNWCANEIDFFVADRLRREGVQPSPRANRLTLVRRLSLDLTGLPPTPDIVEEFLRDDSPNAYERLVDRLLNSTAFGERLGQVWLDLARYADTNGYNNDEDRSMWLWREWVIDAFNANQPMDQFIIEQIAGDLLPNPSDRQRLATGFNRNHVITTEGGIFPEEYRVEYVADRVHTTATVFLGLSLQCARCHDHKYDPFTQTDYYRMFAFFNNVQDKTVGYNSGAPAEPYLKISPPRWNAQLTRLRAELSRARLAVERHLEQTSSLQLAWEQSLKLADLESLPAETLLRFDFEESDGDQVLNTVVGGDDGQIVGPAERPEGHVGKALRFDGRSHVEIPDWKGWVATESFTMAAWIDLSTREPVAILSKMDEVAAHRGFDLVLEGGRLGFHLIHQWPEDGLKVLAKNPLSLNQWHHVCVTYDGQSKAAGVRLFVDGRLQEVEVTQDRLQGSFQTDQPLRIGRRTTQLGFQGKLDEVEFFSGALAADIIAALFEARRPSGALRSVLERPADQRHPAQNQLVRNHFLERIDPAYQSLVQARQQADQAVAQEEARIPLTMVMQELETPRESFVLKRGQYDQPGEKVQAGVPGALPGLSEGSPINRLGLARWLIDARNPLTARVMVNRWWQQLFGIGLVETVEDFGLQGSYPSHPELLDWLAVEFQRTGWDLKRLLKTIVLSETYQQQSAATGTQLERDPRNQLLGRGSRHRLSAETIRDSALEVAGLLTRELGGTSVKPYQPAGLWQDVSVERRAVYEQAKGANLYRRSLYTFWKRTCPPPGMVSFDAPDRETCTIRRGRTNTPLQALVLLNDPTYVEAARRLANEALRAPLASDEDRLRWLWNRVLQRSPEPQELAWLIPFVGDARESFQQDPTRAGLLLTVGESENAPGVPANELASWTSLASILMNLDEFVSRE